MRTKIIPIMFMLMALAMTQDVSAVSVNIENGTCYTAGDTEYCAEACADPKDYICVPTSVNVSCTGEFKPNSSYVVELTECYDLYARTYKNAEVCLSEKEHQRQELETCISDRDTAKSQTNNVSEQLTSCQNSPELGSCQNQLSDCQGRYSELNNEYQQLKSTVQDKETEIQTMSTTNADEASSKMIQGAVIAAIMTFFGTRKYYEDKNKPKQPPANAFMPGMRPIPPAPPQQDNYPQPPPMQYGGQPAAQPQQYNQQPQQQPPSPQYGGQPAQPPRPYFPELNKEIESIKEEQKKQPERAVERPNTVSDDMEIIPMRRP